MNIKGQVLLSCLSAQAGSLIFALFNIVIVAIGCFANLSPLIYYGKKVLWLMVNRPNYELYGMPDTENLFYTMTFWITSTVFLISLVMAVVLLSGIIKKNPEHLKAYLIFGVVVAILSLMANTALTLTAAGDVTATWVAIGIYFVCITYIAVLFMIYRAYQKFVNLKQEELLRNPTKTTRLPYNCCSIQTCTLIFAVINAVVVILCTVISVIGLFYWGIWMILMLIDPVDWHYEDNTVSHVITSSKIVYLTLFNLIVTTAALVSLLFAGFLLNGVIRRKSGHIKVYFVYGVCVDVLTLLGIIGFLSITSFDVVSLYVSMKYFFVCFIYTCILAVIYMTYRKFENASQFEHQILEEAPEKY